MKLPKCGNIFIIVACDFLLLIGLFIYAKVNMTKELDKVVVKPCTMTTHGEVELVGDYE